jgi:hypothetical protein
VPGVHLQFSYPGLTLYPVALVPDYIYLISFVLAPTAPKRGPACCSVTRGRGGGGGRARRAKIFLYFDI